jgi:hypothetical protein
MGPVILTLDPWFSKLREWVSDPQPTVLKTPKMTFWSGAHGSQNSENAFLIQSPRFSKHHRTVQRTNPEMPALCQSFSVFFRFKK